MIKGQTVFLFNSKAIDDAVNWRKIQATRTATLGHNSSLDTPPDSHPRVISEYKIPHFDANELTHAYHDTVRTFKASKMKKTFKGLMFGGILGLLVLAWPFLYIEGRYHLSLMTPVVKSAQEIKIETEYPTVESPSFQYLLNQKYLEILKPVDPEFSIIIPKLSINSKVVPNVDVADKKVYEPALKLGAAHAKGTYFPGENGTTYIFAHSTNYEWFIARYNAIFYLLKDLEKDDEFQLVYKNTVYPYVVVDKKIVGAKDIEYLTPHKGREEVILQTCYPPGTTEKRLLIIARPTTKFPRVADITYSLDK